VPLEFRALLEFKESPVPLVHKDKQGHKDQLAFRDRLDRQVHRVYRVYRVSVASQVPKVPQVLMV